jgi:hypothetical protein
MATFVMADILTVDGREITPENERGYPFASASSPVGIDNAGRSHEREPGCLGEHWALFCASAWVAWIERQLWLLISEDQGGF